MVTVPTPDENMVTVSTPAKNEAVENMVTVPTPDEKMVTVSTPAENEAVEKLVTVSTPAEIEPVEKLVTVPTPAEDVAVTECINNSKTVDEEDQQTAPDRMSKTPSLQVPDNDTPLHEDIPEVISPTPSTSNILDSSASYHLPFRQNRGKPPARFSTDIAGKKSKYPTQIMYPYKDYLCLSRPLHTSCPPALSPMEFMKH